MNEHSIGHALLWETILQKESYPIFRLAYLSTPTNAFTDAELDNIEKKSLLANSQRDVTGILIVHGDKVFQVIEGREKNVRELYGKIEADPRHEILKVVSAYEDEERMLLTWNMVVRTMSNMPTDITTQYFHLYDEFLHASEPQEITVEHIDLFKVIALFAPLS